MVHGLSLSLVNLSNAHVPLGSGRQTTMGFGMTNAVHRWAVGVGLAGGAAVAAAMIGAAGMPAACADDGSLTTDIGLLDSAETNMTDGFNVWTQAYGEAPPSQDILTQFITQTEAIQTPLLSSDNSLLSGLGESLFNGPDQQLAQISDAFLSAAEAYAADPSTTNGLDAASESLQFDDSLLSYSLPANVIGEVIDQIFGIGGFDSTSAGAATDVAASASSAAATPDDVIGQAISDLDQSTTLLDTASTADLGTRSADLLSNSEALPTRLNTGLTEIASMQDQLSASDRALLVGVDQQLVTAAQNLLPADQGFIAADQAGELSTNSATSADWTLLGADLNVLGTAIYADAATLFGVLTGGLDPSSAADLASSVDPVAAVDPSIFADLLSSIGF